MNNIEEYQVEIVTGQYKTAALEQEAMIRHLLGDNVEYFFEIYFHWYNIMHELGHAIMSFNSESRPHPVDEEQLVNDFAFAYWQHYGEPEKNKVLCDIVNETLSKFIVPAEKNVSYIDFVKKIWGKEELYTFNNYGWFQFSCVQNSISKNRTLAQVIADMGVSNVQPQKKAVFEYCVDETMPYTVIEDATKVLHSWGIVLPKIVKIVLSSDPNCHLCRTIKIDTI